MKIQTAVCAALLSTAFAADAAAQSAELPRRVTWGAALRPAPLDSGVVVTRIDPASPLARSAVRDGDRIVDVNGADVRGAAAFRRLTRTLRGGDSVTVRALRSSNAGTTTVSARFVLAALPREQIENVHSEYSSVRSERGYRVRTVVTRPVSATATRLPAILFIPWLSCDPVEKPVPGRDGFALMLRDIAARSGMLLFRVEKPGVGDSEGPDCAETTLSDDVAAYRAALAALRRRDDVDTSRIYIFGGSLGGALAPILAAGVLAAASPQGIAGVISVGGFTKTWYEHMLEIERRRLTLLGQSPAEVNAALRAFAQFYTDYLLGRRTPAEVLILRPELRPLWHDEPEHQYGRHARFYHEVQALDVEGAWDSVARLGIPVLIVWGEFDWIMSRDDQQRAVDIVNARAPGTGTLALLPRVDHGLMTYATMTDAFTGTNPQYRGAAARLIIDWLGSRPR